MWKVLGASVTGTGHERADLPCQDAYRVEMMETGIILIAFADGAGSASLAEVGAQAAVEAAIETLRTLISPDGSGAEWENNIRQAFAAAQAKLLCEADSQGESVRELATTLTLIVSKDLWATVGGSIGDGAVILDKYGELVPFLMPERGEYVNETEFLHDAVIEQIKFSHCDEPMSGIAAFTDGLQMLALKLPEAEPHAGFFEPLFAFARNENATEEELRRFLQSPKVANRTDDDLTLILVV